MRGREEIKKYEKIIKFLIFLFSLLPKSFLKKILVSCRNINGKKGMLIRYILVKNLASTCGNNVSIHPNVYIFNLDNLSIGNNVSIHPMCYIDSGPDGTISIGDDVSIAHGVSILAFNHVYEDLIIPIKDQSIVFGSIIIDNNVWIGAKATILMNNHISEGAIVAANCVVCSDVGRNEIVGGIPNKLIKVRGA